jgi:hypothetical protein
MDEPKLNGIKYFMNLITLGNSLPYIDTDIRKIIWDYALEPPHIILRIVNNLVVKLMVFL